MTLNLFSEPHFSDQILILTNWSQGHFRGSPQVHTGVLKYPTPCRLKL